MSNTSNQKAEKGSKYWMQEIVNNKYLREELENKLGVKSLEWISPLENESYDEYKLTEEKLKEKSHRLKRWIFHFGLRMARNGMLLHYLKTEVNYIFLKQSHI